MLLVSIWNIGSMSICKKLTTVNQINSLCLPFCTVRSDKPSKHAHNLCILMITIIIINNVIKLETLCHSQKACQTNGTINLIILLVITYSIIAVCWYK